MTKRQAFKNAFTPPYTGPLFVDLGKHIGSIHEKAYAKFKECLPELELKNDGIYADKMAMTIIPDESLLEYLGVDIRWVYPQHMALATMLSDTRYKDMWGVEFQFSGEHWDIASSPLKDAEDLEDLQNFDWPNPNDPRMFAGLKERAKKIHTTTDYVIGADGLKNGLLQTALWVRGYTEFFCDLLTNEEFAEKLMDIITENIIAMWKAYLKEVGEYVQLVVLTDDYGMQNAPMISKEIFLKFIAPRNKKIIDAIKAEADVKVFFHCDGAITPFIDDMAEFGVDILNPIQVSAYGMEDTKALKNRFGHKIAFHGGMDVQQVLPNMSAKEAYAEAMLRISHLHGGGGGYIFSPCHNIGHDIPVENILAMYRAAADYKESGNGIC